MNKYKIIALLLVLAMSLCLFSACGDSATPGEKNDKLISETPDDLDIVDDELKKGAEEVTAITGATDPNGKVTDATGIVDKAGHRIYSTGLKDNYGKTIYTTGKKDSKGNILYTKNETDTFGDMIYYTGKYKDGKLELEQTNESPDYSSNETPTTKASAAKITTSTTVGVKKPSKESVDEAKCEYTKFFGGSGLDAFRDIIGCKDGGFVAAGISASKDGDYKGVSGEWEMQHTSLVKYSSDGKVEWKYITGGNSQVNFNDVIELKDGTIVAAGQTAATSGDVVKQHPQTPHLLSDLKPTEHLCGNMFSRPTPPQPANISAHLPQPLTEDSLQAVRRSPNQASSQARKRAALRLLFSSLIKTEILSGERFFKAQSQILFPL